MSACRLASMQFITQVSTKLLRKLVRAARFSEASKAPRNMPKHKSSSTPNCAAESTTIEDSSGPPFSKFAESSTRERVNLTTFPQMVRIAAVFRWSRIGHRGLELRLHAHMACNYRDAHAYSGPYPTRNRSGPDTSCQAKAYPR
jgi:hypothetical protein